MTSRPFREEVRIPGVPVPTGVGVLRDPGERPDLRPGFPPPHAGDTIVSRVERPVDQWTDEFRACLGAWPGAIPRPKQHGIRRMMAGVTAGLSKTQIDRLGERLRLGDLSESDLRSLDDYRRSFGEAYETVVQVVREQLRLEPTGRSAKSTTSLMEKLRRESIRLTQVQDIAGCRVVVADVIEQDRVVAALRVHFPVVTVVDRRRQPSHGYRAVHVIVQQSEKLVEIQVRTELQHLWAELSERLSDADASIKYGGGAGLDRGLLTMFSGFVEMVEAAEAALAGPAEREVPNRTEIVHSIADLKSQLRRWLGGFTSHWRQ